METRKRWLWTVVMLFVIRAHVSGQITRSSEIEVGESQKEKSEEMESANTGITSNDGCTDNVTESPTSETNENKTCINNMTSPDLTSHDLTSQDITSHNLTSQDMTSHDLTSPDLTSQDSLETNTTTKSHNITISEYINYVITPLFLATGLFGNGLTITVMLSREFSSMTMSFILIALAMSDSTVLLMQPFTKLWLMRLVGMDVRALSDLSCKIFFIFFRTSKMCSSWFVVLVCFERFIAVWFPLRARTIFTKRNALLQLAAVIATLLVFNGFWSFASKVVDGTYCFVNYIYPSIATKSRIFTVVGTVMYAGIPSILLIIMTPATIYRILQQTKLRRELSNASLRKIDNNHKTVAMLLSVIVAYILLATPIGIVFNIALVKGENLYQSKDWTLAVIREVAQPLDLLNYSINFFLYVASSKTFRGRVAEIFHCKKKHVNNSRMQSYSGTC